MTDQQHPDVSDEALDALLDRAQSWAFRFAPAVEDANNWYRGHCEIDGKDAAEIGQMFAAVARLVPIFRAASTGTAVEVPEWCRRMSIQRFADGWHCSLVHDLDAMHSWSVVGLGPNPQVAIDVAAAIAAASASGAGI